VFFLSYIVATGCSSEPHTVQPTCGEMPYEETVLVRHKYFHKKKPIFGHLVNTTSQVKGRRTGHHLNAPLTWIYQYNETFDNSEPSLVYYLRDEVEGMPVKMQ